MYENISHSGLSSFFKIKKSYQYFYKEFPQKEKRTELKEITTLSSEFAENKIYKNFDKFLLKIDTQGFEKEVLDGDQNLIKKNIIDVIVIELMTINKYINSDSFIDIMQMLHSHDYIIFDIHPSYKEKNNEFTGNYEGHLTEFDVVYVLNSTFNLNKSYNS